ncbi:MBL fold metallo-hydrolase [Metabacillus halosaccharovorans]|uniref:MBL fold metallo-hydrolase n=1 Tax=Metabacillus halosaccharovorans TaxID=930124 RepID=A0ABT3DCK7_9BACI|nr:MBL fold metallo-hydrolase [Metabacillus halosaccharovorans]MCV9884726.1 MBL fold metallo-hydrolase [Metabacillus halosaccharovorans]
MEVNILASGSGGNCIALRSGGITILVDAGIAKTKIEKRLLDVGIRPTEIKAILVTHAHSDHVKGLPLANKYKIPVFASSGEWKSIKTVDSDNQRIINAYEDFNFEKEFYISSFKTHHDTHDPLGFTVSDYQGNKCSICLDTGKVDDQMIEAMELSNIYIIEANHEPNMVEVSDYPNSVKARIVSHIGHLSNEQTAEALGKLVNGLKERIYLTHLSSKNNMPALAEMTVKRALLRKGYKASEDYEIEVV